MNVGWLAIGYMGIFSVMSFVILLQLVIAVSLGFQVPGSGFRVSGFGFEGWA